MSRKTVLIDDAINEAIEKKVDTEIQEALLDVETTERDLESERQKQEELEKVLGATYQDSYHYAKLYKIDNLNPKTPAFLETIFDLTVIDDLETHIQKLAHERNWTSGRYKVVFFLKNPISGEKPMRGQKEYNIIVPENEFKPKSFEPQKETDPLKAVEQSAKLIKTVRDAIGAENKPISFSDPKAIMETFKMGMDAIKENLPKPINNGSSDLTMFFKEMMTIQMQQMQFFQQMMIAQIQSSKEIINQPKKESDLSNKILDVALTRLLEGGGGEAPSMGVELVRQIAPHVPSMIDRITGTINTALAFASVKKAPGTTVKHEQPPQLSQIQIPLFGELLTAVQNKDYNFFPKLSHGIGYYLDNGDAYLAGMLDGSVTPEMAMEMMIQFGGEQFASDDVKDYINKFFEWHKSFAINPIEIKKEEIKKETVYFGRCEKCKEEYEFDSPIQEEDVCDNIIDGIRCDGKIIKEEK